MARINQVTNYFLGKSLNDEIKDFTISPLKIQKLLYYAQAWNIAFLSLNRENINNLFDDEPVHEDFQAWAHGPVLKSVYNLFRDFGYQDINYYNPTLALEINDKETIDILEYVWKRYGHMEAKQLEKQTHSEDPWIIARDGIPAGYASNAIITPESMFDFYRQNIISM